MTEPSPQHQTTSGSVDAPESESGFAKKALIGVAGGTVTAAGVAMLFLPGPGIATIVGGMAILATEFPAARRSLDRMRQRFRPDRTETETD